MLYFFKHISFRNIVLRIDLTDISRLQRALGQPLSSCMKVLLWSEQHIPFFLWTHGWLQHCYSTHLNRRVSEGCVKDGRFQAISILPDNVPLNWVHPIIAWIYPLRRKMQKCYILSYLYHTAILVTLHVSENQPSLMLFYKICDRKEFWRNYSHKSFKKYKQIAGFI